MNILLKVGSRLLPLRLLPDFSIHGILCRSPEHQDGPQRWTGHTQCLATKGTLHPVPQRGGYFSNKNSDGKACLSNVSAATLRRDGPGVQADLSVHLHSRRSPPEVSCLLKRPPPRSPSALAFTSDLPELSPVSPCAPQRLLLLP